MIEQERKRSLLERQKKIVSESDEPSVDDSDDMEELIELFIEQQVDETVEDEMDDHREQIYHELMAIRKENTDEIN